jgi:DNA-binding transcriptional regulator YiaG
MNAPRQTLHLQGLRAILKVHADPEDSMTTITGDEVNLGAIEKTGAQLGLGLQELAQILGVDQSTFYRWRQGSSAPRALARTRLIQFGELAELMRRLFAGPDLARDWLRSATPASLGGTQTPLQVMAEGRIDRVLLILNRLAAGG